MFDVDDFIVKLNESELKRLSDFQLEQIDDNAIKLKINKEITLEKFKKIINFNYSNDTFFEEFICSNRLLFLNSRFLVIKNENAIIILSSSLSLSSKFYIYMRENNKEVTLKTQKQMWSNYHSFEYSEKCEKDGKIETAKIIKLKYSGDFTYKDCLKRIGNFISKLNNYNLEKYFSINLIINSLNFVKSFNGVLTDGELSLSWAKKENDDILEQIDHASFEIVLNDTMEVVGTIAFDFRQIENNPYFGNVSYEIYPYYRNNGYATKTLKLLMELVKNNKSSLKDLYISTIKSNEYSQKVALNCGAELFFSGEIPEDVIYTENERDINIYKIKI